MGLQDWQSVKQTYYNRDAKKIDNEPNSVAKVIHYSGVDKYYIRDSREGLLNINNILDEYDVKIRGMDKEVYAYTQVSKDAFDLYLEFLDTKSETFLRSAEKSRRIDV